MDAHPWLFSREEGHADPTLPKNRRAHRSGPPNSLELSGKRWRNGRRCSCEFGGSSIHLFAMRDPDDEDEQLSVLD